MEGLVGHLNAAKFILEEIDLDEENKLIVAHLVANLYSQILELHQHGASSKRNETYETTRKRTESVVCPCGGKQKPSYHIEGTETKVCQRCYRKKKKRREKE